MHSPTQAQLEEAQRLQKRKKGYLTYLARITGLPRALIPPSYKDWLAALGTEATTGEAPKSGPPPTQTRYYFNKEKREYVVSLRAYAPNQLVMPLAQHDALVQSLTRSTRTLASIAHENKMPERALKEYMTLFGISRSEAMVVTHEQLNEAGSEEQIAQLVSHHVIELKQQDFRARLLHATQADMEKDAKAWTDFQQGRLVPFENALRAFRDNPAVTKYELDYKAIRRFDAAGDAFVVTLSDVHFGLKAVGSELSYGADYDTETAKRVVLEYSQFLVRKLRNMVNRPKHLLIFSMGDILHGLRGETEKGVLLETDTLREDQYLATIHALIAFLKTLAPFFSTVDVHAVKGNHAGSDEYYLFDAISRQFTGDKKFSFHLYRSQTAQFVHGNNMFILSHGASDYIKARTPNGDTPRSAYWLKVLARKNGVEWVGQHVYVLQGDRHSYERKDLGVFELIVLPTAVLGCRYADHNNFNNRPAQKSFIFSSQGLEDELTYYPS